MLASFALLILTSVSGNSTEDEGSHPREGRAYSPGEACSDHRLGPPRTLNDAYHPWQPARDLKGWLRQKESLSRRLRVSVGLWPEPPKTELRAVIHSRILRDGYSVEKVSFESLPGHAVTGSLYRPLDDHGKSEGKRPGVLSPHGHWHNGRFLDQGEVNAREQIEKGGEAFEAAARSPLQARMVQLARMGCVVFHYDMVGYASSRQIAHGAGFSDAASLLQLQSAMALQTWNSIRALDFLLSLDDVDPDRIGVTGASGGGTQTFILGALDPRPDVAFPAVMVSTAMQGGCVCENAPYLRVGLNNIALTALFAPRPLGLSGADDWTKEIETKGYPELRHVYGLHGCEEAVVAEAFPQFEHNYNRLARDMMYEWFRTHLPIDHQGAIVERDFERAEAQSLEVFDAEHPPPKGSLEELKDYWKKVARAQLDELIPKKESDVNRYRDVVGGALEVMIGPDIAPLSVNIVYGEERSHRGSLYRWGRVVRTTSDENTNEEVPFVVCRGQGNDRRGVLLWVEGEGKDAVLSEHRTPVETLAQSGFDVILIDVLGVGEHGAGSLPDVNTRYAGYTFGYNRPLISERVRDIVLAIEVASKIGAGDGITLAGTGDAGTWVLLAAASSPTAVDRILADTRGFRFANLTDVAHPMMLPGAVKYGDLDGLAALVAPRPLTLFGEGPSAWPILGAMYDVHARSDGVSFLDKALTSRRLVEHMLNVQAQD